MEESPEFKGIYRIHYNAALPNVDGRNGNDMYSKFEGRIENFYPGGKSVFYNEQTNQILIVQYCHIRDIYPIKKYTEEI